MDGIRVNRVALYPSHDKSAIRRILNYLSFAASTLLIGPWIIHRPDIVYVYNLVTLGPTAFLFRVIFGSKVILDVQDLWPESVTSSKMLKNKLVVRLLKCFSNWIYRHADHLIVLSPGFKRTLENRKIPSEKIDVLYNWCDESSLTREAPEEMLAQHIGLANRFNVLFAGTMGILQGLDTVLNAAKLCLTMLPTVQFVFIGGGVDGPRLEQRAKTMRLENVRFLTRRPPESMGKIFALADVLLVHLMDHPLFRITIPSKTKAYLFMGKPIIMAVNGDAADLVRKAGAGIICEPGNPHKLVEAANEFYHMTQAQRTAIGKAGQDFYNKYLCFEKGVENFERICLKTSQL